VLEEGRDLSDLPEDGQAGGEDLEGLIKVAA
jgi:hypothetical protein